MPVSGELISKTLIPYMRRFHATNATARCGNIFPAREYRINIVFPWPCRKYRPCRGAKMAANGLKNRIRGTLYTFERQFPLTKGN